MNQYHDDPTGVDFLSVLLIWAALLVGALWCLGRLVL
jgi:hypothetical protein